MTFFPDHVPPANAALDTATSYQNDVPFNVKQGELSMRRHRWFQPFEISTASGLPYQKTRGLAAGATMRIQFDNRPDFIIVSISGETANTGRVIVYSGDPGGDGIRLGPGGKVTMPASQGGIVTLVNAGTTPTYGVVLAVAGYTDPGVDILPGS